MGTPSSRASEPIALRTLRWGVGGRRALLLHGIGSNAAGWWRVGCTLASAGWAVTAPDLRGHGKTGPADDYSFAAHLADLMALGRGWDVVLGHSMGALIATLAASADSGWAKSLILQDPALVLPDDLDQVIRWLVGEITAGALTPDRLASDNPRWLYRDAAAKAESLSDIDAAMIEQTVRDNWPWMALEEAAALDIPTVVIGSDPETGGILPVTIGAWLADSNPWIDFRVLPGSSHSAHRDADVFENYRSTLFAALARLPTLGPV